MSSKNGYIGMITQRGNQNPNPWINVIEQDPATCFNAETGETSSFDNEFSEARGLRGWMKHRRSIQKQRQNRRDLQAKSKAMARINRTSAKKIQANAQTEAARMMGKENKSDIALAEALKTSTPIEAPKKSNTALYLGIGAGVLVVGAIVTVLIIKSRTSKK